MDRLIYKNYGTISLPFVNEINDWLRDYFINIKMEWIMVDKKNYISFIIEDYNKIENIIPEEYKPWKIEKITEKRERWILIKR